MRASTPPARGSWLVVVLLVASCTSPPHKEMDQAQGAIDAARAAGAEKYAATEFTAANEALTRSSDAVAARDYRLALNHALESREQAQNAARTAAATRATLRGNVERSRAEVIALLAQTRARLDGTSGTQNPRRRSAQRTLTGLERGLQKADAALHEEDYTGAERMLTETKAGIQEVAATISRRPTVQSLRRQD